MPPHWVRAVSYIDFQLIDRDKLCDLDSLLRYLAARLARALKTARKPEDYWDPMLGAKDSLTEFVEDAVLNPAAGQVSLLFDEADRVFDQSAYCEDRGDLMEARQVADRTARPLHHRQA
jgi:AAA domain-containing protein